MDRSGLQRAVEHGLYIRFLGVSFVNLLIAHVEARDIPVVVFCGARLLGGLVDPLDFNVRIARVFGAKFFNAARGETANRRRDPRRRRDSR